MSYVKNDLQNVSEAADRGDRRTSIDVKRFRESDRRVVLAVLHSRTADQKRRGRSHPTGVGVLGNAGLVRSRAAAISECPLGREPA